MGYTYCFYISVDNPEIFEVYKNDVTQIYNQLKTRNWFPKFGKLEHSGSGGYGTGPNDKLLPEFIRLTSLFPDFTFKLWMTHWDETNLYVVEIKNDKLLSTIYKNYEHQELLPGLRAFLFLTADNIEIDNDITHWFTG